MKANLSNFYLNKLIPPEKNYLSNEYYLLIKYYVFYTHHQVYVYSLTKDYLYIYFFLLQAARYTFLSRSVSSFHCNENGRLSVLSS